jgi:hypothetical protein
MPGISRTLLAQRLRHLELRGVLRRVPLESGRGHEYHLTDAGRDLEPVIMAIGEWAVRWLFAEPLPTEVDPVTLTWWLHRRVDTTNLPDDRVVIEFDYTGADATTLWLVLDRGEPSVCVKDPGLEVDLVVVTDPVSMMRVFSGITTLADAIAADEVRLFGPSKLVKAFGHWFLWSPFITAVRTAVRNEKHSAVAARRT